MGNLKLQLSRLTVALAMPCTALSMTVLTFEDIVPVGAPTSTPAINGYYSGGTASNGASGANVGATFGGASAIRSVKATPSGSGLFGTQVLQGSGSPGTSLALGIGAMFLTGSDPLSGTPVGHLDVAAGFNESFSFYYAAKSGGITVTLYEALTADILGTTGNTSSAFAATDTCSVGDPGSEFCRWALADFGTLSSTYYSVKFQGPALGSLFDNLSFSSSSASGGGSLPEPGSLALVAVALAGLGLARRRKG